MTLKCKPSTQAVPALEGLAVIDVVEGTARAALPHMAAVLAARPSAFPSLRAALDWAKRSGAAYEIYMKRKQWALCSSWDGLAACHRAAGMCSAVRRA